MLFQVFINKFFNFVSDFIRMEAREKFAYVAYNPLRQLLARQLLRFLPEGTYRALSGEKNNGGKKLPGHQIQVAQPFFNRTNPFVERFFRHGISVSGAIGQTSTNLNRSELELLEKRGLEVRG